MTTDLSADLSRRAVLRAISIAALALGVSGTMAACGTEREPGPDVNDSTGLEPLSSDVERSPGSPAEVPGATASLHALGAGLYRELSGPAGNLALSPYSVGVALALTLNGAKGETLDQMLGVLDADGVDPLNGGLNALTEHIEGIAGSYDVGGDEKAEIVLDVANTLFGEKSVAWARDFLDTLAANYGAGLQLADFVNESAAATDAINAWVAEQTRDKIPVIIPPGLLDDMTRLVLVNTLYLKAPWATPFEKSQTVAGPFRLTTGESVQVPRMVSGSGGAFGLGVGDGWRATRLPYAGGALAMTIVLPDQGRLGDVEATIAAGGLSQILESLATAAVELTIPRWTFRFNTSLVESLAALGMKTPFGGSADFSGMTEDEDLFISDVIHEVFIAVDEVGTEAAAVTAVMMRTTGMPAEPVRLVVDRPFLFVIHDVEHGTPLFLGRVADPRPDES
jgi:serpin B